jgi:hypothetical protein
MSGSSSVAALDPTAGFGVPRQGLVYGWLGKEHAKPNVSGIVSNCTFRDFLILERSKTSGKRDPLGNNDYF